MRTGAARGPARGTTRGGASFDVGDVVLQRGTGIVGVVCSEVARGHSYMVRFADSSRCILVMRDGMSHAPPGTEGPDCDGEGC
jgi:hypothetical protein